MNTNITILAALILSMMVTSSCVTLSVTPLNAAYKVNMSNSQKIIVMDPTTKVKSKKTKGEIFETYPVYYSSSEVKKNYQAIAFYKPFVFQIPIFLPWGKAMAKQWLTKSMKKCAKLGGNAIILQSPGWCIIILEDR